MKPRIFSSCLPLMVGKLVMKKRRVWRILSYLSTPCKMPLFIVWNMRWNFIIIMPAVLLNMNHSPGSLLSFFQVRVIWCTLNRQRADSELKNDVKIWTYVE